MRLTWIKFRVAKPISIKIRTLVETADSIAVSLHYQANSAKLTLDCVALLNAVAGKRFRLRAFSMPPAGRGACQTAAALVRCRRYGRITHASKILVSKIVRTGRARGCNSGILHPYEESARYDAKALSALAWGPVTGDSVRITIHDTDRDRRFQVCDTPDALFAGSIETLP